MVRFLQTHQQLGDFGNYNSQTGAWVVEGNIFDIPELAEGVVVKEGLLEEEFTAYSDHAKVSHFGIDRTACVTMSHL